MKPKGISKLDLEKYPHEYYKLTAIAKATGLSSTHLRACPLQKYRFGNADYMKVAQINRYLEGPEQHAQARNS